MFRSHDAVILDGTGFQPPAFAIPVDDAIAGDGEIRRIGCADQGLLAGGAKLRDRRIVGMIG